MIHALAFATYTVKSVDGGRKNELWLFILHASLTYDYFAFVKLYKFMRLLKSFIEVTLVWFAK